MSEPQQAPAQQPAISEEFFLRVNDFLQMANRIERRFDSHHAEFAMMHAFARYSAHHYRSTVKTDGREERVAFCNYIANMVAGHVAGHMDEIAGPTPVDAGATPAESENGSGTEA